MSGRFWLARSRIASRCAFFLNLVRANWRKFIPMKTVSSCLLALFTLGRLFAADMPAPAPKPADKTAEKATARPSFTAGTLTKPDAAWLASELPKYPLDTCVVSGDKLGDMGTPLDKIYKLAGKPDRLVRFCCGDCPKDFLKDPAKYLKLIDDAVAAKTKAATTPAKK